MIQEYSCQHFSGALGIFPVTIAEHGGYGGPFPQHMSLGANLRALRAEAKLTQEQLAEQADVQQSDISKWENDTVRPDLTSTIKLARALRISLDRVVVGLDPTFDAIISDLSRQRSTRDSAFPSGGGVDEPTAARVRELQARVQQLEIYEALINQLRPVLADSLESAHQKTAPAPGAKTGSRRHARKPRR